MADAGCTSTIVIPGTPIKNVRPTKNPITLVDAKGGKLVTTHEGEIDIPGLPLEARRAHVCPDLAHTSLISIKQLADVGCKIIYDELEVRVIYHGKVVWRGGRDKLTGQWILPLSPDDPAQLQISVPKWLDAVNTLGMNTARMMSILREQANKAYATTTKADLIQYLHQAAFSPVKKTWMKAIENGQFATWPGLTKEAVQKYLAESSPATDKGHTSSVKYSKLLPYLFCEYLPASGPFFGKYFRPRAHKNHSRQAAWAGANTYCSARRLCLHRCYPLSN